MCHRYPPLPGFFSMGEKLVGTHRSSFYLRHLYHEESPLVILEEIEKLYST